LKKIRTWGVDVREKRRWLVGLLCALKRRAYYGMHVLGKYDAFDSATNNIAMTTN